MPGIKVLRKIQFGVETTAGTPEAADVIWRGKGLLKDDQVIEPVEEDVGLLQPTDRSYTPWYGSTITLDEIPATFEHICYLFETGIEYIQTATAEGSGYLRQYDLPTTAANTTKTLTVEAGDNQRVDECNYVYPETITLSWASDEAVMMSATLKGRQATDAEYTDALTLATVEEILAAKGTLKIDDSGGTIGTTAKTGTLLGGTIEIDTGLRPVPVGDGSCYFSSTTQVGPRVTGSFTFRHDATGEAELGKARTESVRLVRLQFDGSALSTAGSTYSTKALRIDMAIQYTEIPELSEDDGDDTIVLPWRQVYSSADSLGMSITVVNNTQTLT